jgi:carbon-monoxide dehydrogenase large subunit
MIAEGQIHGGALHGLGGALCEELGYDEAGQCITATFHRLRHPTAEDAPPIEIAHLTRPPR